MPFSLPHRNQMNRTSSTSRSSTVKLHQFTFKAKPSQTQSCQTHHTQNARKNLNHKFCFSVVSPKKTRTHKTTHQNQKGRSRCKGAQRRLCVIGPVTPCRTGQAILEEHASKLSWRFSLEIRIPPPTPPQKKGRTPESASDFLLITFI